MSKEVLLQTNNTNINARTIKPIMEEQELNKFSHIPNARKWPPKGTAKDIKIVKSCNSEESHMKIKPQ